MDRTDRDHGRFEAWISTLLFGGVFLSISLLTVAMIWQRFTSGVWTFDYQMTPGNLWDFLRSSLTAIPNGGWRPRTLLSLGIAVLMMTPYLRVLASVLYFALAERNWKYTFFTAFVLAALSYHLLIR